MKSYVKSFRIVMMIVNYVIFAVLARSMIKDPKRRRSLYLREVTRRSRYALGIMGYDIVIENPENLRKGQNYMIVANHMSYIDALIMAYVDPMCFVTSMEMKEAPVLGLLTEVGGCLYVERRSKENLHNEIFEITDALSTGFHVVIFPEATSTDGSKILPFKRPLLTAAVQSQRPILPMVIQYEEINDEKVTSKNRDKLCWYGSMGFAPHFFSMLRLKKIRIRVKILPEISVNPASTRDILVEQAYDLISQNYQPIV